MFGKNPLRKVDRSDGSLLLVHSIFGTIQGEGPFAGRPAVFVRLAGCNLACHFCDTEFEAGAEVMTVAEIIAAIGLEIANECRATLVVITGGEPLRQPIGPLVVELNVQGLTVQLETAGTVWPNGLDPLAVVLVCSPKTGKVNEIVAAHCRDWKYICAVGEMSIGGDGLPICSTQRAGVKAMIARPPIRRSSPGNTLWLQPRMDYMLDGQEDLAASAANAAEAARLCMKHGYRLTLQMHKTLGLP